MDSPPRRACGSRCWTGSPTGSASSHQVVWGRYDPSFQVEEAEAYRRDVPHAEVHVLDADHFAFDEQPDVIADLTSTPRRSVASSRASRASTGCAARAAGPRKMTNTGTDGHLELTQVRVCAGTVGPSQ